MYTLQLEWGSWGLGPDRDGPNAQLLVIGVPTAFRSVVCVSPFSLFHLSSSWSDHHTFPSFSISIHISTSAVVIMSKKDYSSGGSRTSLTWMKMVYPSVTLRQIYYLDTQVSKVDCPSHLLTSLSAMLTCIYLTPYQQMDYMH